MAVTCAHVLAEYRNLRESDGGTLFQIGSVKLDPFAQLIAEDCRLDLATIQLSQRQIERITSDERIGSCVFRPVSWPGPPVKEGDLVAFGGFPGAWREYVAFDEIVVRSFSSAHMIASVSEDRFACQFERESWVWTSRVDGLTDLQELGGMSGAPAFIHRDLYWDFVGIIYEFSAAYDIMFFRPARLIRQDGSIHGQPA